MHVDTFTVFTLANKNKRFVLTSQKYPAHHNRIKKIVKWNIDRITIQYFCSMFVLYANFKGLNLNEWWGAEILDKLEQLQHQNTYTKVHHFSQSIRKLTSSKTIYRK